MSKVSKWNYYVGGVVVREGVVFYSVWCGFLESGKLCRRK